MDFSSPQTFKLSSREPNIIQLVTRYNDLVLGPWSIHFLFQNTRKVIMLHVTNFQTNLSPSPAGRELDWGGACVTGTLPFKDNEKNIVKWQNKSSIPNWIKYPKMGIWNNQLSPEFVHPGTATPTDWFRAATFRDWVYAGGGRSQRSLCLFIQRIWTLQSGGRRHSTKTWKRPSCI